VNRSTAGELFGKEEEMMAYYSARLHVLLLVKPGGMNELQSMLYASSIRHLNDQKVPKVTV
jgi:hypothetical protein